MTDTCPVCYDENADIVVCWNSHSLCSNCYKTMMASERGSNQNCAECRVPMFRWAEDGTLDPVAPPPPPPVMRGGDPAPEGSAIGDIIANGRGLFFEVIQYPNGFPPVLRRVGDPNPRVRPAQDPATSQAALRARRAQREARAVAQRLRANARALRAEDAPVRRRVRGGAVAGTRRVRHCSCCRSTDHDRRTCPVFRLANSPAQ